MPDNELQELKTTLNTIIPQIVDRDHTAIAVDDNASDEAFLDSYNQMVVAMQSYLSSATPQLQEMAGEQANLLSALQVTGQMDEATIRAIQVLKEASDADTEGKYSAGIKKTIDLLAEFSADAQALPAEMRQSVDEASATRTASRPRPALPRDPNPGQTEARQLVQTAESYLGVTNDPTADVLENTGRALKDYLKAAKAANPDLDAGIDFTPQTVDRRTQEFMHRMLQEKMRNAGVTEDNLHTTLIQIWEMQRRGEQPDSEAMRELGKVGAMSSMVDYIFSGRLPSGNATVAPRTDSPWENPASDSFFNGLVYHELSDGRGFVSHQALFNPPNANPEQQELIASIAERLGIEPAERYTSDQVGQIAMEIMIHQAKMQCIDEKDITQAMVEGRFNPAYQDMMLAEAGLGKPPRDQARVEELERIGISPEEQSDTYFAASINHYRDQAWAERFGALDDEHIFRMVQRMHGDEVPQNVDITYNDVKDQPRIQELMEFTRQYHSSAPEFFKWSAQAGQDDFNFRKQYEEMRRDHYLPALREKISENALDLCNPDAAPVGGPTATDGVGEDGVCYADDTAGPCEADAGGDSDGVCYADDFDDAHGTPCEAGSEASIHDNTGDLTGQTDADAKCYADDMVGPDCGVDTDAVVRQQLLR